MRYKVCVCVYTCMMCKNILITYHALQWWKQEVAESLGLKNVCNGFVSVGKCCFLVCQVALVLTLVHHQASFPLGSEEHGTTIVQFSKIIPFDVIWVFQTIKIHSICGILVDAWRSHSAHLITYRIQEDLQYFFTAVSLATSIISAIIITFRRIRVWFACPACTRDRLDR